MARKKMARKKKKPAQPSVAEIQDQLAQLEVDKKALEETLRKQRTAELSGFAKEIRDQIIERGYTVDEVVALLSKSARRTVAGPGSGGYPRYADPDNPNNTYSRGPVPQWLKEKMIAAGYEPADREQRDRFKADHLQLLA